MAIRSTASADQRKIKLRRGISYTRSYTYTQRDSSGVQIPLVATDFVAELVVRQYLSSPTPVLSMTSPSGGLTLSTVSGSVRITVFVSSAITSLMGVMSNCEYTLALIPIANPTAVIELISATVDVTATAL